MKPDYADTYFNLGLYYAQRGQEGQAEAQYRKTLRYSEDYAQAHNNLAVMLVHRGAMNEAIGHLQRALNSSRTTRVLAITSR